MRQIPIATNPLLVASAIVQGSRALTPVPAASVPASTSSDGYADRFSPSGLVIYPREGQDLAGVLHAAFRCGIEIPRRRVVINTQGWGIPFEMDATLESRFHDLAEGLQLTIGLKTGAPPYAYEFEPATERARQLERGALWASPPGGEPPKERYRIGEEIGLWDNINFLEDEDAARWLERLAVQVREEGLLFAFASRVVSALDLSEKVDDLKRWKSRNVAALALPRIMNGLTSYESLQLMEKVEGCYQSPDPEVRAAALQAAGGMIPKLAEQRRLERVEKIEPLLSDESPEVRIAAVRALSAAIRSLEETDRPAWVQRLEGFLPLKIDKIRPHLAKYDWNLVTAATEGIGQAFNSLEPDERFSRALNVAQAVANALWLIDSHHAPQSYSIKKFCTAGEPILRDMTAALTPEEIVSLTLQMRGPSDPDDGIE